LSSKGSNLPCAKVSASAFELSKANFHGNTI
jgi:hypothetical protein